MKVMRFEDPDVWKEATPLAVDIYGISRDGKLSKEFSLLDQLRK
jgi:hypothetical protein